MKAALDAPLGTVTADGTVTAELELESETLKPLPLAALESVTVHLLLVLPVNDVLLQLSPDN